MDFVGFLLALSQVQHTVLGNNAHVELFVALDLPRSSMKVEGNGCVFSLVSYTNGVNASLGLRWAGRDLPGHVLIWP